MKKKAPRVGVFVLPGGFVPERKTEGAVGYDVRIRSVLSSSEMDKDNPALRKTLFDFIKWPEDPLVARHVVTKEPPELLYRMEPEESVLVGIGFITKMDFPMFYRVAPRSGLATKYGLTVTNAPGTVDPDYRGEAGVLVYNRNNHAFDLFRGMRIAQIIFQEALIPELMEVFSPEDLGKTPRGSGGFGSTGIS